MLYQQDMGGLIKTKLIAQKEIKMYRSGKRAIAGAPKKCRSRGAAWFTSLLLSPSPICWEVSAQLSILVSAQVHRKDRVVDERKLQIRLWGYIRFQFSLRRLLCTWCPDEDTTYEVAIHMSGQQSAVFQSPLQVPDPVLSLIFSLQTKWHLQSSLRNWDILKQ